MAVAIYCLLLSSIIVNRGDWLVLSINYGSICLFVRSNANKESNADAEQQNVQLPSRLECEIMITISVSLEFSICGAQYTN